jgi:hypothetical protein
MTKSTAGLSMTAADHRAIGSTPSEQLAANPDQQCHELMSDEELRGYLAGQIMSTMLRRSKALSGDHREVERFNKYLETCLMPNLAYLKSIGRLPEILEHFDAATAFALPERTDFYLVTGKTPAGISVAGCNEQPSGWSENDEVASGSFLDTEWLLVALDHASAHGYPDVIVRAVNLGGKLSGGEIRKLTREHPPTR